MLLSRAKKDTSKAAALAGSTISGRKTLFQGVLKRNPQAPQNFLVESLLPKVRVPPMDMNENSSWPFTRKKMAWSLSFLFYVRRNDAHY